MAKCSETGISNSVVTDISNMQQLLTFVKNLNIGTGEPEKKFLHTADLLSDRIGGNKRWCKIDIWKHEKPDTEAAATWSCRAQSLCVWRSILLWLVEKKVWQQDFAK